MDVDQGVIAVESERAMASATPPTAARLIQRRKRDTYLDFSSIRLPAHLGERCFEQVADGEVKITKPTS
jgi:hypothetical protein